MTARRQGRRLTMKAAILICGTALLLSGCGKNDKAATGPMTAEQVASKMNEVKLEPGEWEATQEILDVQMTGLPKDAPANAMKQMVGQKNTVKHCITPNKRSSPARISWPHRRTPSAAMPTWT